MAETWKRGDLDLDLEDLDQRDVAGDGARICSFCSVPCQMPEADGATE